MEEAIARFCWGAGRDTKIQSVCDAADIFLTLPVAFRKCVAYGIGVKELKMSYHNIGTP